MNVLLTTVSRLLASLAAVLLVLSLILVPENRAISDEGSGSGGGPGPCVIGSCDASQKYCPLGLNGCTNAGSSDPCESITKPTICGGCSCTPVLPDDCKCN